MWEPEVTIQEEGMIDLPTWPEWSTEIQALNERVCFLRQRGERENVPAPELLAEALEELQISLEVLRVTHEELCDQNEELLATREALETERQRYKELFELAPEAYVVTDAEGTILEANRAAAERLGIPQRFLIGKPLVALVEKADWRAFHYELTRLLSNPNGGALQRTGEWELRLSPRGGTSFPVTVMVAPMRDAEGKVTRLRWLLRSARGPSRADAMSRPAEARAPRRGVTDLVWQWPMIPRVLIVNADRHLLRALRGGMVEAGYTVVTAASGEQAIREVERICPDLILLDLDLPGMTGYDVCRAIRPSSRAPILVLTRSGTEREEIDAFEAGADVCIRKPFSPEKLLAQVRAQLRRCREEPEEDEDLVVGDLRIDLKTRRVTRDGVPVRLTRTEFEILRYLALNAGRILTHGMILQYVRGAEHREDVATLRVHIANLRQKIEADPEKPQYILTEIGVGYRFASR